MSAARPTDVRSPKDLAPFRSAAGRPRVSSGPGVHAHRNRVRSGVAGGGRARGHLGEPPDRWPRSRELLVEPPGIQPRARATRRVVETPCQRWTDDSLLLRRRYRNQARAGARRAAGLPNRGASGSRGAGWDGGPGADLRRLERGHGGDRRLGGAHGDRHRLLARRPRDARLAGPGGSAVVSADPRHRRRHWRHRSGRHLLLGLHQHHVAGVWSRGPHSHGHRQPGRYPQLCGLRAPFRARVVRIPGVWCARNDRPA